MFDLIYNHGRIPAQSEQGEFAGLILAILGLCDRDSVENATGFLHSHCKLISNEEELVDICDMIAEADNEPWPQEEQQ